MWIKGCRRRQELKSLWRHRLCRLFLDRLLGRVLSSVSLHMRGTDYATTRIAKVFTSIEHRPGWRDSRVSCRSAHIFTVGTLSIWRQDLDDVLCETVCVNALNHCYAAETFNF